MGLDDSGQLLANIEDLAALSTKMLEVCDQITAIDTYVAAEVCNPTGFATSDISVLQPLAGVMGVLAESFSQAKSTYYFSWVSFRDALNATAYDLDASDGQVSGLFAAPTKRVDATGPV